MPRCLTLSLLAAVAIVCVHVPAALGDIEILAPGRTFDEPVADPRWPRFAASWQEYDDDEFLGVVGAVAIGGTLALIRQEPRLITEVGRTLPSWEVGVQTAVFGTFEPLEVSQDMFNSDWQFGVYAAARRQRLGGIVRLWHQSSHLGDEFLLNSDVVRQEFSFESISGLASLDAAPWLRIYGGGGWIFDEVPRDFGNFFLQYGVELRWPDPFANERLRPFVAIDLQQHEATDWQVDLSLTAGVELCDPRRDSPVMRFVIEFYDGRNLNGQFFAEDARYVGAGVRLSL